MISLYVLWLIWRPSYDFQYKHPVRFFMVSLNLLWLIWRPLYDFQFKHPVRFFMVSLNLSWLTWRPSNDFQYKHPVRFCMVYLHLLWPVRQNSAGFNCPLCPAGWQCRCVQPPAPTGHRRCYRCPSARNAAMKLSCCHTVRPAMYRRSPPFCRACARLSGR
jgi:hypothetical protein